MLLPVGDRAIVQKDMHTPVKIGPLFDGPRGAWDTGDFVRESPTHRHFAPCHPTPDLLTLDQGTYLGADKGQRWLWREDHGQFFRHIVEGSELRLHADTKERRVARDACQDVLIVQADNGDRTPYGYGHWRPRCLVLKLCDSACEIYEIVLVLTVRVDNHGRIEWFLHIAFPKGPFLTPPLQNTGTLTGHQDP